MNKGKTSKEPKENPATVVVAGFLDGGDEEDRTLDLTDANRTLSQLSYAPVITDYCDAN